MHEESDKLTLGEVCLAKTIARFTLARSLHLKEKSEASIKRLKYHLTDYEDEEALRLLKPDEPNHNIKIHRMVNHLVSSALRKRGATVIIVKVNASAYLGWLRKNDMPNNAANRALYISTAPYCGAIQQDKGF
ncbi:MAG: hypothetical protein Q8M02_05760 [Candidatus Didemnitutus sp.]|nr:hypothetical protein [Candidatus Didemnitutus sp.]